MFSNDLECQKMIEWRQSQTIYLTHIVVDSQQLSIQLEDKSSGDLWNSIFLSKDIQELTVKAKNPKKYAVFVRMLLEAFQGTNQQLQVQILSYRQLSNRFAKGAPIKAITPEQAAKRFVILSYSNRFQKMQFPLPITPYIDISNDRLRLTIKRMALENSRLREGQDENQVSRQASLLRYENESLKNKLKMVKSESSTFLLPKSDELEREIKEKNELIQSLKKKCQKIQQLLSQKDKKIQQSDEIIKNLNKKINQSQKIISQNDRQQDQQQAHEQQLQNLIEKMAELGKELQYAKQKDKKNELKIQTLQKQLQNLIAIKQSQPRQIQKVKQSSPHSKKSDKSLSLRSGRSNQSLTSDKKGTQVISKKTYGMSNINNTRNKSNRKSSIYDSDTESSKMRKLNNMRTSPYRQTISNITNNKKSSIKGPLKERSRSKSRQSQNLQKKRAISPRGMPQELQSQMLTEVDNTSSEDQRYERIENYMHKLKQRKGATKSSSKKGPAQSNWSNRVQVLEDMIKKAAMSTKIKQ